MICGKCYDYWNYCGSYIIFSLYGGPITGGPVSKNEKYTLVWDANYNVYRRSKCVRGNDQWVNETNEYVFVVVDILEGEITSNINEEELEQGIQQHVEVWL